MNICSGPSPPHPSPSSVTVLLSVRGSVSVTSDSPASSRIIRVKQQILVEWFAQDCDSKYQRALL